MISIIQAILPGIEDKWELSHKKATTIVLVPTFILSFLFITGAGLYILDLADYIANNIGIVVGGVIEVFLIGWLVKPERFRLLANEYSNFGVGRWWNFCLKFITLIILGYTMISNMITYFVEGYAGYPMWCGVLFILMWTASTDVLKARRSSPLQKLVRHRLPAQLRMIRRCRDDSKWNHYDVYCLHYPVGRCNGISDHHVPSQ